jgi:hypothetical protein
MVNGLNKPLVNCGQFNAARFTVPPGNISKQIFAGGSAISPFKEISAEPGCGDFKSRG